MYNYQCAPEPQALQKKLKKLLWKHWWFWTILGVVALYIFWNYQQHASIISSVATLLTALFTLFMVLEIKKQREATYHPEIILSRINFKGDFRNTPKEWKKESEIENNNSSNNFSIDLYNIGLGAAKDVSVRFSFPVEEMIRTINELARNTKAEIKIKYEHNEINAETDFCGHIIIFHKNIMEYSVDYIIPISNYTNPTKIPLPMSYMFLVSTIFCLKWRSIFCDVPHIPPIKIDLEYYDISDQKLQKSYEMILELNMIQKEGLFRANLLPKKLIIK